MARGLDDYEGTLTRNGIRNVHGIVKFEVNKVFHSVPGVPTAGWEDISPLAENVTFRTHIVDGR